MSNWFEELMRRSQQGAPKYKEPRLVAFYWDGGPPEPHAIREISARGLYLLTEARWYVGTLVTMRLQRTEKEDTGERRSIAVQGRVVANGTDGVEFEFALHQPGDAKLVKDLIAEGVELADQRTLQRFLLPIWSDRGQSLVEYILLLPLLFLLVVNMVNFGGLFFAWITVANAARAGADYAILGGASVNAPALATAAQINTIVTNEVSSLPNNVSVAVNICRNSNGTYTTLSGSCASAPATDPESTSYAETWMDVTYTYQPLIAAFSFPSLNIYATLPSTTIHRRAVMRLIQ